MRVVDNSSGASTQAKNAVSGSAAAYISNDDYYNETYTHNSSSGDWVARYPGILGNSVKVSVCQSKAAYESTSTLHTVTYTIAQNSKTLTFNQDSITLTTDFTVGDCYWVQT